LVDQGWRVESTKQGHYQGFAPDGRTLITFAETNEPRAMHNNLADLRRTGQFQWPPPDRRLARTNGSPAIDQPLESSVTAKPCAAPQSDLDTLFKNLKAAKSELVAMEARHNTVIAAVRDAEAALEQARRLAERAGAEATERARLSQDDLDLARRLVMEAKAEFDAAFEWNAA
jgi:hypothetical protein